MGFSGAGRAHEEQPFFPSAGIFANKSLREKLGFFQRVGLLRRGADVCAVAFEIAVFVAFGDAGALDDALGPVLHAAVAGNGYLSGGPSRAWDELPAGSLAKRAILERHADSIRSGGRDGKASTVGIRVRELGRAGEAGGGTDDGVARFFVLGTHGCYAGELLLNDRGEFGHLALH